MYNIYFKWKLEKLYKKETHILYESEFSCCWFSCTIYDNTNKINTYLRYTYIKKNKIRYQIYDIQIYYAKHFAQQNVVLFLFVWNILSNMVLFPAPHAPPCYIR